MGNGEILNRTFQWGFPFFILPFEADFSFEDLLGLATGMEGIEGMATLDDGEIEMTASLTTERVWVVIFLLYLLYFYVGMGRDRNPIETFYVRFLDGM